MEKDIMIVMDQLLDFMTNEKNNNYNAVNALGEVEINGKEYQIQISLIVDKKLWIDSDKIVQTEVTRVY